MAQATFSVGGLASGMDTQSIIDKLVQLESRPLAFLQQREAAIRSQVSLLGDLASRLADLRTAAADLSSGGVVALQATSTGPSVSAAPGAGAITGTYDVRVTTLATAAKWRSGAVDAAHALQPGTLTLRIGDASYPPPDAQSGLPAPIRVTGGESIDDLAAALRATGAPIAVAVLDDGTSRYLSVTTLSTGAASRLEIDFSPDEPGATATPLSDPTPFHQSTDASFTVDGLSFTRPSNVVTDALPGTTLTLRSEGGPAETLTIADDVTGTQARLQRFVAAYDTLISAVQKQLAVTKDTDRATTLAGDTAIRSLQQALQRLTSTAVPGLGAVRALADVGVRTERDGTLSLDTSVLASALARDPAGVDAAFGDAASGIAQQVSRLADAYAAPTTGLLALQQTGMQDRIRSLDDQQAALQGRIDAYRDGLVAQFTAMENVVGQLKTIGNFLTSQDAAADKK